MFQFLLHYENHLLHHQKVGTEDDIEGKCGNMRLLEVLRFGPRFPDMTEVYSKRLRGLADATGEAKGIPVMPGIYAAMHGPSYETPAEVRFLRTIGADAVGMSTAPEAIVARHMGLEVLGISCITNAAAGVFPEPLHHSEVMETAQQVKGQLIALLEGIIGRL